MGNSSLGISKIIQPTLLQRAPDNHLSEELLASRCQMDDLVAASCADLVQDFGLKATSDIDKIQCLVAELVSGWMMEVTHQAEGTWADLGSIFAHAFAIRSLRPLRMKETESLKLSFLFGVCRGLRNAKEKNIALQGSPANLQKLRQKAISVGLENPSAILRNEIDAAKIHLAIQHKGWERRYLPSASQLLLQDEVDVEAEGNDDGSDDMDLYEFDEGGMIL